MIEFPGKGRLAAAGKSLEWQGWGNDASAPVIVLLHEGLGCLALWRDFPERLAAATGLRVFAWSRAGYGRSDAADLPRPLDYMTREAMDAMPDVLAAIGADRYILMGHSDGATIAAEYAGRHADHRIRGLVLMAPHFFTEPAGLAAIAAARRSFEADLKPRMARYHANPEATFFGWNDAWLAAGFRAWHVGEVIDYLRVPALVIQGADDQYGSLAQVAEVETRSYAPVEAAILDGCRHSPHLDQPGAVLDAVAAFAARLLRIERETVVPA